MEESDRYRGTTHIDRSPRGIKASRSPPTRPKAKEVGMFISVPPNNRQFQQPHELRPSTPEWVMAESPVVTTSVSHDTVGGLTGAASAHTRRMSVSNSMQGKLAARRVSTKRQRGKINESRFGKARTILSKTVQSLQVVRNDLEHSLSGGRKSVQSIATQTCDPDEAAEENTNTASIAVGTSRRMSRIPIPYEKSTPREKTPVRSGPATNSAEPCISYALGNVYSLMTNSVSETKLEDIYSSTDLSVSVKPVLEAQESCTVLDVDVLRLAEVKSKEVDVDRTLENWRPTTAVVSLVPEAKAKSTSKKSIVKKERSKDDKGKKDELPSSTGKVPVVDLDKEAFQVPVAKSKHSEKRSSKRGQETPREDDSGGGTSHGSPETSGGGSSCRVRFSPHLIAPSAAASNTRAKTSSTSTKAASSTSTVAAISKFPELLKRVTDQAITSIAKTVILGLPQQLSRYDLHQAESFANHHSPMSSQSFAGNYRSLPTYSRVAPMTMSTLNMHDDGGSGYRIPSRNHSQLSVTSLINYPSSGGGGSAHLSGRYAYLSPHHRMSSTSSPKMLKDLDNRYSLHQRQSGLWDTPGPRTSWIHDSSSSYGMLNSEYGPQTGTGASGHQFWLRYQKLKNQSGPWSTTSSSSSLYTPQRAPKYERPSQRFSVIRNHSAMRVSLDDLQNSTMNNQSMDAGSSLRQPMGMDSGLDSGAAHASYNENLYV